MPLMPTMAEPQTQMPWTLAKLGTKRTPKAKERAKTKVAKAKRVTNPKERAMATSMGRKGKTTKRTKSAPSVGAQATESKTAGSTPKEKARAKAKREETW